jgi:hypothetical protein
VHVLLANYKLASDDMLEPEEPQAEAHGVKFSNPMTLPRAHHSATPTRLPTILKLPPRDVPEAMDVNASVHGNRDYCAYLQRCSGEAEAGKTYVYFDSAAQVNIYKDKHILTNIRPAREPVRLHGVEGEGRSVL